VKKASGMTKCQITESKFSLTVCLECRVEVFKSIEV